MTLFPKFSLCTEFNGVISFNFKAEKFYENSENIGKLKFTPKVSVGVRPRGYPLKIFCVHVGIFIFIFPNIHWYSQIFMYSSVFIDIHRYSLVFIDITQYSQGIH